jgi:uncharacterized protein (TIGR03067 family)
MHRFAALVAAAAVAALAGCRGRSEDLSLAQGEWVIASAETPFDGEQRAATALADWAVAVKGTRATVKHVIEKDGFAALVRLDPTKTPNEFDAPEVFVTKDRDERVLPAPVRGIYKFEGDELVIALALAENADAPRPVAFQPSRSGEKPAVVVFHLKRK